MKEVVQETDLALALMKLKAALQLLASANAVARSAIAGVKRAADPEPVKPPKLQIVTSYLTNQHPRTVLPADRVLQDLPGPVNPKFLPTLVKG